MVRQFAVTAALIVTCGSAAAAEYLDKVESPVVEVQGASVHELAERARVCISQKVTYGSVVMTDDARVNPMYSLPGSQAGNTTTSDGGDVLRTVDLDAGLVIAQSRVPWSFMMIPHSIESTITFEAREGRFKITQTGIQIAQLSTGYATNTGFRPVLKQWGSHWEAIEKKLQDLAAGVSECVSTTPSADW